MADHDLKTLLISEQTASRLVPVSLETAGFRERDHLQRWIEGNPDLIEPGLLVISEEFADWEGAGGRVRDRLDLLLLDARGQLLVAELKRGAAPDRTESQALLYAAYCNQLVTDDVVGLYAKHHNVSSEVARAAIVSHAESLDTDEPGQVRVRIVAEEFPPSVTATVLFLREISNDFDIGCVKLTAFELPEGAYVVSAQPIIPIPETEEFQVRRRRRETEESTGRRARNRTPNAVPLLQAAEAIDPGADLRINLDWFSGNQRPKMESCLAAEPAWGVVQWTGEKSAQRAVRTHWSDEPVSLAAAWTRARAAANLPEAPDSTSGWIVGSTGTTLRRLADELLADEEPNTE